MRTRFEYLTFLSESIPKPRTRDERQNLIEALAIVLVAAAHVHSGAKYCAYEQIETVTKGVLDNVHQAFTKPL